MDKAPVYGTGDSRFDPWQDADRALDRAIPVATTTMSSESLIVPRRRSEWPRGRDELVLLEIIIIHHHHQYVYV